MTLWESVIPAYGFLGPAMRGTLWPPQCRDDLLGVTLASSQRTTYRFTLCEGVLWKLICHATGCMTTCVVIGRRVVRSCGS